MSKRYKQHRRAVINNPFKVKPYGFCPVQAEGEVGKFSYYFRSRGTGWSVTLSKTQKFPKLFKLKSQAKRTGLYEAIVDAARVIGEANKEPKFYYTEHEFVWPMAGYIDKQESIDFATDGICRCLAQACAHYKIKPQRLTLPLFYKSKILCYML